MVMGIVGSEAKKFTPETEVQAKQLIRALLLNGVAEVCSGECHLGGIDSWAHEIANELSLSFVPFPPYKLQWEGGYKQRNLKIAQYSDMVVCITVKTLPPNYTGMKFTHCYHCRTNDHIKSGGCWTVKQAQKLGKPGTIFVVG